VIEWKKENYATSCQFPGNDASGEVVIGASECGPLCERSLEGCNHFNWKEGLCYLKQGKVRRDDALFVDDVKSICGYIPSRL
jgi:hypothetical protein